MMETLKLLEWNINQRSTGRKMPDFVADEILTRNPDVIVLVEFKGKDNLSMLKGKLSNYYVASYNGVSVKESKKKRKRDRSNGIFIALKKDSFSKPDKFLCQEKDDPKQPNWLKIHAMLNTGSAIDIIGVKVRIEEESTSDLKDRRKQIQWICSENSESQSLIMLGDLNYGPFRTDYRKNIKLNWQDIIDVMRDNNILNRAWSRSKFLNDSPYSPYSPFGSSFKNEQLDWLVAKNVRINKNSSYNQLDWSFGRHNTQSFKNGYLVPQGYFIRTDPSYPDHAIFTAEISVPSEKEKTGEK